MESQNAAADDGRPETRNEQADRNWSEILQEVRVSQTGTQIISGFLLTLAFQQRFNDLDSYQDIVYGVLVAFAAVSTALGLAIVSLHRARFHQHDKPELVAVAGRLLVVIVWTVAILTAGVVLFIFDVVFGHLAGFIAGAVAVLTLIGLLALLPNSITARFVRDK